MLVAMHTMRRLRIKAAILSTLKISSLDLGGAYLLDIAA